MLRFFLLSFLFHLGSSIRCYHCDEKSVGLEWCSRPTVEECPKEQESICLKYVYTAGKKNWPNHIIFKCVPRWDYSHNQINACDRSSRQRQDGTVFLYETCTCDQDQCNHKHFNTSQMNHSSEETDIDRVNSATDQSPPKISLMLFSTASFLTFLFAI